MERGRTRTILAPLVLAAGLVGGGCSNEEAPAAGVESGAPAPPPTVATQVDAGLPVVVFLGDSISAGLHLPAEAAFPALLRDRLEERGLPFRLVNAGTSGDTSAGGLSRVDWLLRQSPDVVVVELGGNDGLRGVSDLESIESNLRTIIEKVRAAGAEALLLGMRIPSNYGDYAEEFAAIYPRLARELEVPFVPFFMEHVAGVEELNLPDGIHPNVEGHELLAENVEEALAELVARAAED